MRAGAHAAKLVPSVPDRSSRSRMNFTRIEVLAAVARNPWRVFRRATATTCSEGGGASPGRTARIQEPKDRQTSLGVVAGRISRRPRPCGLRNPRLPDRLEPGTLKIKLICVHLIFLCNCANNFSDSEVMLQGFRTVMLPFLRKGKADRIKRRTYGRVRTA